MAFVKSQWIVAALGIPQILGQTVSDMEWEHFNLVNQLRAAGFTCPQGTTYAPNSQPLVFECNLWKASQLHSKDMAQNNYFSHTSQDGRSPWQRAAAVGASANGENIAAGSSTAQAVLEQWKKSDGHCNNMGKVSFRLFAVGYGYDSSSAYEKYWTQMFGSSPPSGGTDTSCYPTAVQATTKEETTTNIKTTTTKLETTTATLATAIETTTKLVETTPTEIDASTTGGLSSTTLGGTVTTVLQQLVVFTSLDSFADTQGLSSAFANAMSSATRVSILDVSVSVASAKLKLVYSQLPSTLVISNAKSAIANANNVTEDAVFVTWIAERRRLGLKSTRRLAQTASAEIMFTASDTSGVDMLAKVKSAKSAAQATEVLASEIQKLTGTAITPPILEDGTSVVVSMHTEISSSASAAGQSFADPSVIELVGQLVGGEVTMDVVQVIVPTTSERGETVDPSLGVVAGARQFGCGIIPYLLLVAVASFSHLDVFWKLCW